MNTSAQNNNCHDNTGVSNTSLTNEREIADNGRHPMLEDDNIIAMNRRLIANINASIRNARNNIRGESKRMPVPSPPAFLLLPEEIRPHQFRSAEERMNRINFILDCAVAITKESLEELRETNDSPAERKQ